MSDGWRHPFNMDVFWEGKQKKQPPSRVCRGSSNCNDGQGFSRVTPSQHDKSIASGNWPGLSFREQKLAISWSWKTMLWIILWRVAIYHLPVYPGHHDPSTICAYPFRILYFSLLAAYHELRLLCWQCNQPWFCLFGSRVTFFWGTNLRSDELLPVVNGVVHCYLTYLIMIL